MHCSATSIFKEKINIPKPLKSELLHHVSIILNKKFINSTAKVFNTVYSLAKRNRPFSDLESEIELQIKNELDMGIGLQSRQVT